MAIIRNRRRKRLSNKARSKFGGRYTVRKSRPSYPASLRVPRFSSFGGGGVASQSGFSQRTRTKLKYAQMINLDASSLTVAPWHFRANSLYDPDYSGTATGHQPMGFDQYSAIYSHYRVYAMKWKVTINPENVGKDTMTMVGTYQHRSNSTPTGLEEILEKQWVNDKHRMVTGTGQPVVMRGFTRINKLAGMNMSEFYSSSRTQALTSSSPDEQMIFSVWSASPDYHGVDDPQAVTAIVELTYYAEFREVNNIASS